MKTKVLTNAKLTNYETLNNSYYGNPRYRVVFANDNESILGKTATNASCGYIVTNFRNGELANVEYHETAKGNIIIDSISKAV